MIEMNLKRRNIYTLTSDLGIKDYYLSILKGQILQIDRECSIIDITSNIEKFNLSETAFIFKNAYHHFPEGTIHLVGVNSDDQDCVQFLVFEHKNHFFIGPDNGIFSLIFDEKPNQIFVVPYHKEDAFPMNNIIKVALNAILSNNNLSSLRPLTNEYKQRITLHPVTSSNMIRGTVIHIDHFENVIVNIHQTLFEQMANGRDFEIYYRRWNPITKIVHRYQDVAVGEVLAMFNSSGYLEIAVNMGQAATLLGLEIDNSIQIDFL